MANIYFSNSLISVIKWTIGFAKKPTERYEKGRIFELLPVRGNVSLFPSLVYYDYVFCEALNALSPSPPLTLSRAVPAKTSATNYRCRDFPDPNDVNASFERWRDGTSYTEKMYLEIATNFNWTNLSSVYSKII